MKSALQLVDLLFFFQHFLIEILIVVVMIVSGKKGDYILFVKELHILLDLFTVLIFPLTVCIICIEVISIWWNEWGLKLLVE